MATHASAYVNSTWFQELPEVQQHAATDFLYEQSPQSSVPYTGEAAQISESVSETYATETDTGPSYAELASGTTTAEMDVGLIPEVGTAVPEIWAAGGAFAVGWKVGEGINAIFADIGLGSGSAPEPDWSERTACVSSGCGGGLVYEPHGTDLYYGATVQESPGAYLYDGVLLGEGQVVAAPSPMRWFAEPCTFSGFTPPPGSSLQKVLSANASCSGFPVEVDYPYVSQSRILSTQTLHRYDPVADGSPDLETKAPPDPETTAVEEEAEVDLDQNEFMQAYIQWAEEPEPKSGMFPDPKYTEKGTSEEERRCDRGTSTFSNVEGNVSPEPFAQKELASFTIAQLPIGVESPSPVYLRYGETYWKPARDSEAPKHVDNFGGWGFRHIAAKHGWSPLDRVETEEALATAEPRSTERGTYVYESLDSGSGKDGVNCTRRVIVDLAKKQGNPAPRGIVTSFNIVGNPGE
jgi:hypothetical protein